MNRSQSYCFHGIVTISFFLFLHPLLNTFASPPTLSKCRPDQRDALLELKDEFPIQYGDGFYSAVTTTLWNKSVDCCSWDGVTCDAISGKVISLELHSYNVSRTSLKSSSGLFKLKHLRTLDLSSAKLQGEIPSSIGNLSHLTHLDLSFNQLVGEVPVSIGNLNQLRHIDLSENNFIGNIPTSFANLTKLEILKLDENGFIGGDTVLANLTNLSEIDLSFNKFTSSVFSYLSGFHKLKKFSGSDNSFSGFFPSSLLMIPSLNEINLRTNQFEGPIDFGNTASLSQLRVLTIRYNNFDGLISKSISKLRNLEYLDLSHNNFVGRVPRSLSKLVNLGSLDLSYNKLEGEVPHYLWTSSAELSHNYSSNFSKSVEVVDGASSLTYLNLGSNSLQGPIPQWICKLSLNTLVLSNNHFTGSIPQCLKRSTSLRDVNLRNNSLSGFIPDLCTNSGAELGSLDVSHNNLKGKLPKSLMNCKSMVIMNVKGNKIKDKFPFLLGSLPSLSILLLGSNAFYGPVYNSSTYLGFPYLSIIDISNNNFVGSLPQDFFGNWTKMSSVLSNEEDNPKWEHLVPARPYFEDSIDLMYKGVDTDFDFFRIFEDFRTIDFSGNRFSGHIPSSIGRLNGLCLLNLSGNSFTGSIPPSLANITKLEALDLSRNNLSGKIPPILGNLSFLSYINFSHNHLEGLVPQSTQFGTQKCSSFVGNSGLYGLEQICGEIHIPIPASQQSEESLSEPKEQMLSWIAATIAYVPGVFCGLVIGHIFTSYKHEWFMEKFGRKKPQNLVVHTT